MKTIKFLSILLIVALNTCFVACEDNDNEAGESFKITATVECAGLDAATLNTMREMMTSEIAKIDPYLTDINESDAIDYYFQLLESIVDHYIPGSWTFENQLRMNFWLKNETGQTLERHTVYFHKDKGCWYEEN